MNTTDKVRENIIGSDYIMIAIMYEDDASIKIVRHIVACQCIVTGIIEIKAIASVQTGSVICKNIVLREIKMDAVIVLAI